MIGGGLYGIIPAFFKAKFDTNETLLTLMLNYIALYVIDWLTKGAWQDPESKGYPKIARFDLNAWLDSLGGVQIGWVIGLVLVVLVFIYLKYTKQGYEITVVSDSHATARYAGMSPSKIMIRTMFLSGAICGIAGMVQACGTEHTLSTSVVLSPYCSNVLQGIILFFVLGCEFFIRYRFVTRGGRKND